ncbi:MAG: hypothetical protein MJE77_02090 [Proteobacteria bacterium]|nr:hypothetical protein [Pseudomonadota bacterium]
MRAFQGTLTPEISETELSAFIRDIENGNVVLNALRKPCQVDMGCVEYQASNGWTVRVFKDRNEWDYFDRFESNDGRMVTLTTMPDAIQSYRPDPSVAAKCYEFGAHAPQSRISVL